MPLNPEGPNAPEMMSSFLPSPQSSFRVFSEVGSAQRSPQESSVLPMKHEDGANACNLFMTSEDATWFGNLPSDVHPLHKVAPQSQCHNAMFPTGVKAVDVAGSTLPEDPAIPLQFYELMSNGPCISATQLSERYITETKPSAAAESNMNSDSTVRQEIAADAERHGLLSSGESSTTAQHVRSSTESLRHGKYSCEFPGCSKTFDRRYNLKVHGRRHTGETPYTCRVKGCSRTFKWRSSMSHHNKSHERLGELGPNLPIVQDKNIGTYKDPFGRLLTGDGQEKEPADPSKTDNPSRAAVTIASRAPRTCTEFHITSQGALHAMSTQPNNHHSPPTSPKSTSYRALCGEASKGDAAREMVSHKDIQEAYPVFSPVSDFDAAFKEAQSCPALPRSVDFDEFSAESFSDHRKDGDIQQSNDHIWPENESALNNEGFRSIVGFHQDIDDSCIAALWPASSAEEKCRSSQNGRPVMYGLPGQPDREKLASVPLRNGALALHCPNLL
jgi:hypothetical protein